MSTSTPRPAPGAATAPRAAYASRRRTLSGLLAAGAAVVGLAFALRLRDPHVAGSWGFCPTALMGLDCPLCGGLRGVNDLMHGEWVAAASSNLLLVTVGPLLVLWWLAQVYATARGRAAPTVPRFRQWQLVLAAAAVLVFTVLRNLPGSWLAA